MSYSDPKMNHNFDNRYDNSDLQMDRKAKDIASAYTEYDEMKAYKMYIETLEAESRICEGMTLDGTTTKVAKGQLIIRELDADGKPVEKLISITELLPKQGEFEQTRRGVIAKLNALKNPADLKKYFAEFETESIWELSSKITNFLIDNGRRKNVTKAFSNK